VSSRRDRGGNKKGLKTEGQIQLVDREEKEREEEVRTTPGEGRGGGEEKVLTGVLRDKNRQSFCKRIWFEVDRERKLYGACATV